MHSGLFDRSVAKADGDGTCAVTTIIPGSSGFYSVPSGCDKVKVRLWGQGGASWLTGEGGVPNAGIGGGGGYTFGIVNLSSGFTTIGVSLPPFQQFGGGNGGGRTRIYQGAGSGL